MCVDIALGLSLGYFRIDVKGKRFPLKATMGSLLHQITDITIINPITTWRMRWTEPFTARLLVLRDCEPSLSWFSSLMICRCTFEYAANSSFIEIDFCSALSFKTADNKFRSSLDGLAKHAAI